MARMNKNQYTSRSGIRDLINAEEIVHIFMQALRGERTLSNAELGAGKTLLNKVLPDLKAVEHTGQVDSDQRHIKMVEFVSPPSDREQ